MKNHFFGQCTNGTACIKLYEAIQDGAVFIKKHKITQSTFYIIFDCLKELWKNGKTQTFSTEAANTIKKYGFDVSIDENNINYIIE
jgi:hypothetical protein